MAVDAKVSVTPQRSDATGIELAALLEMVALRNGGPSEWRPFGMTALRNGGPEPGNLGPINSTTLTFLLNLVVHVGSAFYLATTENFAFISALLRDDPTF